MKEVCSLLLTLHEAGSFGFSRGFLEDHLIIFQLNMGLLKMGSQVLLLLGPFFPFFFLSLFLFFIFSQWCLYLAVESSTCCWPSCNYRTFFSISKREGADIIPLRTRVKS